MLMVLFPYALLALPLLYFAWRRLRVVPPPPQVVTFPGLFLLNNLTNNRTTAATLPPWLLWLRLLILALLIIAAAQPFWRHEAGNTKPLTVVVDNSWSIAGDFSRHLQQADELITESLQLGRPVAVYSTTRDTEGERVSLPNLNASQWQETKASLQAYPWPAAWGALGNIDTAGAEIHLFTGGLLNTRAKLPDWLKSNRVHLHQSATPPQFKLTGFSWQGEGLSPTITPLIPGTEISLPAVGLFDADGALLEVVAPGLPLKNENAAYLGFLQQPHPAGRWLATEWQPAKTAILVNDADIQAPLLGKTFLQQALPAAQLVEAKNWQPGQELPAGLQTIFWPGEVQPSPALEQTLITAIEQGTTVVRFAAEQLGGPLPLSLRFPPRNNTGNLTIKQPIQLGALPADSPLSGMLAGETLPTDIIINKQLLPDADPALLPDVAAWATLSDGTPLVSAKQQGEGWLVLVHVTAGPQWSNLPLNYLYVRLVEQLQRVATASGKPTPATTNSGAPALTRWLTAGGELASPYPTASNWRADSMVSHTQPPGFYGDRVINLADRLPPQRLLKNLLPQAITEHTTSGIALWPWLVVLAGVCFLLETIATGWLLASAKRGGAAKIAAMLCVALLSSASIAETPVSIGVINTGNAASSIAGVEALRQTLQRRTSARFGQTTVVDPATDDLALHPVLYWPSSNGNVAMLPEQAVKALYHYLQHHGLLIIAGTGSSNTLNTLRQHQQRLAMLQQLPAAAVPENHVLRRSYYLLPEVPLWAVPATGDDQVSPVVISLTDLAESWAAGDEQALRLGINMVMYAFTGTYKNDKLHLEKIMERLGR